MSVYTSVAGGLIQQCLPRKQEQIIRSYRGNAFPFAASVWVVSFWGLAQPRDGKMHDPGQGKFAHNIIFPLRYRLSYIISLKIESRDVRI